MAKKKIKETVEELSETPAPIEETMTAEAPAAAETWTPDETVEPAQAEVSTEAEAPKVPKVHKETARNPKKMHGKKYRAAAEKVEANQTYAIAEAIALVKVTETTTFDSTVEVHAKLASTSLRSLATLPHGSGKEKNVVIIDEQSADELIAKIEGGWLGFDVLVATPAVMPRLAKLAKVLGPKGLMPSPKAGTVTDNPTKAADELKGGRVELRADKGGALHQAVGKVSWDTEKLTENIVALLQALPISQTKSLWLTTTMGPSIRFARPDAKKV